MCCRSCTTRTATGTRAASAALSATRAWPRSPSTPATTARSCVANAAPYRTATVARAATRWSCQVGCLPRVAWGDPAASVLRLWFVFQGLRMWSTRTRCGTRTASNASNASSRSAPRASCPRATTSTALPAMTPNLPRSASTARR